MICQWFTLQCSLWKQPLNNIPSKQTHIIPKEKRLESSRKLLFFWVEKLLKSYARINELLSFGHCSCLSQPGKTWRKLAQLLARSSLLKSALVFQEVPWNVPEMGELSTGGWPTPLKNMSQIGSSSQLFWANYNNSLTWIKAIWGWFPLLTMISSELVVSSL